MTTTSATPQRLYLFQLAAGTLPAPTGQMMDFSAGCYLVQTGDGKNVLIDSGYPLDYASRPGAAPIERGKNVIEQLAPARLAVECACVKGDRVSDCEDRGQTRGRLHS